MDRKILLSRAAGKVLIVFFIAMLIFTIVSRVAASFTVAKVTVKNPEKDRLMYSVSGVGEIKTWEEERFFVVPGYRVEDVRVSVGDKVNRDTIMFQYSVKNLQDKYDSIKIDIEKVKLQISQEKLRQQGANNKSLKLNLLLIEQAIENLKAANIKVAEAKKDYEDSKIKLEKEEQESRQKDYERKQKEQESREKKYNEALKNYELVLFNQDKQLKLTCRIVDDARAELSQANRRNSEINMLIDNYIEAVKGNDELAIWRAKEDISEALYAGADSYEVHKEAIYNTAMKLEEDNYYLRYLFINILQYEEELITLLDDIEDAESRMDTPANKSQSYQQLKEGYKKVLEDYFYNIEEYDKQLELIENSVLNTSGELKRLRRNDIKLKGYLSQLDTAIMGHADIKAIRRELYDFIMGDKAKAIDDEIDRAKLALTRAEEDYELLKREFEMVKANLQLELTELKNTIVSHEDGTYDLDGTLEGKIQAIKAAEEGVRIAEQVLETAKLQYELAKEENKSQDTSTKNMAELNLKNYEMDLHKKELELEEVGKLLETSGEVFSPYDGVITHIGIEAGKTTSGEEMIKIGTGIYVFEGAFYRDEDIKLELGDNVDILLVGRKNDIESEIGKVLVNKEGMVEFISSLPQEEYCLGEKAKFNITTESEQFNECIPIQALREDNYGYYIMVIGEREDILGRQLIAERKNVILLAKGKSVAAVDGLSSKSQVITDSNKSIKAGDRVRIE